jgi:sugar/nucleoside kinase (ribokinase family)
MGKASKSAAITAQRLESEIYAGGVLAVANHISNFVDQVELITTYGNNYGINYIDLIKEKLGSNVKFSGIYTENRPTILKKRFVDNVFKKQKLFEIVEIDDSPFPEVIRNEILSRVDRAGNDFDLIVVADFGHGLIDEIIAEYLTSKKTFLSVNAQTNSANTGFNLLTQYPRCDYFAIDKEEARLATHSKFGKVETILENLISRTSAQMGAITLGVEGSIIGSPSSNLIIKTPIFSDDVVDTIGAGDAFLSITSLMAKNGNSIEEIGFVGNAVGAMAVRILGNKSFIEKIPLMKYLKTLLT